MQEEEDLLTQFKDLDFQAFDFHGYIAKRRIVEFGIEYGFSSRKATATQPIPAFLYPYKQRAAAWANLLAEEIVEAVITEYPQGAPIGWHRDVPQFETITALSSVDISHFACRKMRIAAVQKCLDSSTEIRSV